MNTLKLQNSIFKALIEIFIWNKKLRSKAKAKWVKFHLKKYVDNAVNTTEKVDLTETKPERPIIWQYWHQGIENAPLLIQKCIASLKEHHPDCDIRVLSFDNINDYVTIPQRYYDLLEKNEMAIAHFSDILRLYLLTTYGGTWIDATLYFTDRIPQEIFESDFCTVEKDYITDNFGDRMSCYFIHAKQNSIWTHLTRTALENYWAENDYLIHYFIFEHIVSMIAESTSTLQDDWAKMNNVKNNNMGHLRKLLYEDFDEKLYEDVKQKSFMHKLSYKVLRDKSSGKTFYDKIAEGNL